MTTAYAIQTDAGIRLFDTITEASAYEGPDGFGYEVPVPVKKDRHYRGPCGPEGILFTAEDVSYREMLADIIAAR